MYNIKEILILIYVLLGFNAYYDRIADLGFTIKSLYFLVFFSICVLGLILTAYIKNHILRFSYAVIIFLSSTFYLTYKYITSSTLTYNVFISLVNSRGFAGEAFVQFQPQILLSVSLSLILFFALILKPNHKPDLINKFSLITPVLIVFFLSAIFYLRGGDGAKGLESPFVPLAYSVLASYEASQEIVGEREEVKIKRGNINIGHDIILIIDESISPGYLDINSAFGVTNFKKGYDGINLYNYGYAAAITNCSNETNLMLRYGGTRTNYLTSISRMPSIWQYAKKAALNTVYIDAQRTGGRLQNWMTKEEKKSINEFIQFDNVPVVSRDLYAASKLIDFINNNTQDFIIVNKMGAHFPVHDKFPDEFALYKPMLPRGRFLNISDTGSREGFSGEFDEWHLYRNSYRNTLLWNVDHFFKKLLTNSTMDKAIIIYTSDHGQDLHENGKKGVNTHCSPEPRMDEGMVPLIIMQGRNLKTMNWEKHLASNKNKSSHYNIFPTLLSLMYYEPAEIKQRYGNSLNLQTDDELTFNTLFHARLGKEPRWKKIDPMNIAVPPENR